METSLTFLILSSVLLGVNCNCNPDKCRIEVRSILNSSNFCNSFKYEADAVTALRKCIFWEEERTAACPIFVRNSTVALASELQAKYESCPGSFRQLGRVSCASTDYFTCVAGLGSFAVIPTLFSLPDISSACGQVKKYLYVLDVCKSCMGNFFGSSWTAVQTDVEKIWGMVTSLLGGACDCAGKIQFEVGRINKSSSCRYIQSVSRLVEGVASDCITKLVHSVRTFDWLRITNDYIRMITTYTNNACFFAAGASTAVLGLSTIIFVLSVHFLILTIRN